MVYRELVAGVLSLPFLASRYIDLARHGQFYLPSREEMTTLSLDEIKHLKKRLLKAVSISEEIGCKLSVHNIKEILWDLPRHDSFNYINNGSLTAHYFEQVAATLDDPHLYLVISNTGSAASDIISLFTRRQYNHASLAFDAGLRTTLSYNGGERLYPPGLNAEMIDFFIKTPDSSILVYSLECPPEKKQLLIDKIKTINDEGSAYNMLGLVLKRSQKPNIMFCSQFVYQMLDYIGLAYFQKADGHVNPTDLIELDYYKKLTFVKKITLTPTIS